MDASNLDGEPRRYLLAWEDFPHRRDLGRFIVAQVNDLGGLDPLTPEEGEVLVDVLEERGLLQLDDETFSVPILDRAGWQPLVALARATFEQDDPPPRIAVRIRATPPSLELS